MLVNFCSHDYFDSYNVVREALKSKFEAFQRAKPDSYNEDKTLSREINRRLGPPKEFKFKETLVGSNESTLAKTSAICEKAIKYFKDFQEKLDENLTPIQIYKYACTLNKYHALVQDRLTSLIDEEWHTYVHKNIHLIAR